MAPLKKFWDDEQARHHARRRLQGLAALALPGDGHLAHLRARQGRHRRLARPRRARVRPEEGERRPVVSIGPSLPRSLVVPGVPVACVAGPLERYGFLPQVQGNERAQVLERFAQMYSPAIGSGPVMDYLGETGLDSLKGADILKVAPEQVQVDGAVPEHADRPEAEGHRPGAYRRSRHADLLLRPRHASTRMPARTRCTAICGPP